MVECISKLLLDFSTVTKDKNKVARKENNKGPTDKSAVVENGSNKTNSPKIDNPRTTVKHIRILEWVTNLVRFILVRNSFSFEITSAW